MFLFYFIPLQGYREFVSEKGCGLIGRTPVAVIEQIGLRRTVEHKYDMNKMLAFYMFALSIPVGMLRNSTCINAQINFWNFRNLMSFESLL